MAHRVFSIEQAPERFAFRLGHRVAAKDAEGYASQDSQGMIVGGRWEGDPDGGSYDSLYRVQRSDGHYFEAREIELFRIFDDVSLRQEIGERCRTFRLPRSMPERPTKDDLEKTPTARSPRGGETCSACDHKIRPREHGAIEYEYLDGRVFRFHVRCNAVWLEERRR